VFEGYSENHNWTHKSCLDVTGFTNDNIVKRIISMCLDVTGFTNDNMNARKDLDVVCDRPSPEAKPNARGKLSRPKAP
jgi:hypothetical protein